MKPARETTKSPGRRFMQTLVSSDAAFRATKLSIELGPGKGRGMLSSSRVYESMANQLHKQKWGIAKQEECETEIEEIHHNLLLCRHDKII
jgi:hypothetical protein